MALIVHGSKEGMIQHVCVGLLSPGDVEHTSAVRCGADGVWGLGESARDRERGVETTDGMLVAARE